MTPAPLVLSSERLFPAIQPKPSLDFFGAGWIPNTLQIRILIRPCLCSASKGSLPFSKLQNICVSRSTPAAAALVYGQSRAEPWAWNWSFQPCQGDPESCGWDRERLLEKEQPGRRLRSPPPVPPAELIPANSAGTGRDGESRRKIPPGVRSGLWEWSLPTFLLGFVTNPSPGWSRVPAEQP